MSLISFTVSCSSPIYQRMDALYNHIKAIPPHKRPRVWLYQVFDIRRVIFDEFTAVRLTAAEFVYIDTDKLKELEGFLKLHWSTYTRRYVPYWQLWLTGYVLMAVLALWLHLFASLLGSLTAY